MDDGQTVRLRIVFKLLRSMRVVEEKKRVKTHGGVPSTIGVMWSEFIILARMQAATFKMI